MRSLGESLSGLPIDEALPALRAALAVSHAVVLEAPPGAGKSTVVPLALLAEPWMSGRRLVMLEPRRLAARAVAQRMACTLGEPAGHTVGYRMRLETRVSPQTRIEVVTEGVLTRMLQSDPALEGTALVVFDEFHERSVQADLGLALTLDAQATVAPELKLLIMSATLDARAIAEWLGGAPVIVSPGRSHPVAVRFVGRGAPALPGRSTHADADSPERIVARAARRALKEEPGDVLVFLPGAAEIRRVQRLLESADVGPSVRVRALHGELPAAEQDEALAPGAPGTRKVILSTNIAETSLTVEGVRVVVDSGLVRRSAFDPASGMSRLVTGRISRASAEQRCGRAGRLAPGVCYRLWSEEAHRGLAPQSAPEILDADLAALALELAAWGVREAGELRWLDPPPPPMLASARELLARLGAVDRAGRITAHGRAMAALPVHPRLAHLLLKGRELGAPALAAQLAAVLSERDILLGAGRASDADVRSRLELIGESSAGQGRDRFAIERARRTARLLGRQLGSSVGASAPPPDEARPGLLLAFAYPDRIGRRRSEEPGRYLLANGRGACFAEPQSLARQDFIVAVDLDDSQREARIRLAAPLERSELERYFAERIETVRAVEWSEREQGVVARETTRLDALVLGEKPLADIPSAEALAAMLEGVRRLGLEALPWTREARELKARIELVRGLKSSTSSAREREVFEWPAVDDAALAATLERWLAPGLEGVTRRAELARVDLGAALRALIPPRQQRTLDALAPTHLEVPSGSRVRIDYLDENAPVVAVRLQEVFGLTETPRIAGGLIPVTFKLLSPAQRPVQITRDLASFWRGAYGEVRKALRGRYPKHYWPENPLEAAPTRRSRSRP
ncbi:MAG TPA: ATP-dependent helicase HrpB [Steroidobacteraceae bacterium]|nr:ATP-dependent helicase HrpB [Steroidobacteraceae bacterium]